YQSRLDSHGAVVVFQYLAEAREYSHSWSDHRLLHVDRSYASLADTIDGRRQLSLKRLDKLGACCDLRIGVAFPANTNNRRSKNVRPYTHRPRSTFSPYRPRTVHCQSSIDNCLKKRCPTCRCDAICRGFRLFEGVINR